MSANKVITIRYSKAGYQQYMSINLRDEKILHVSFSPCYVKQDEVPSLEGIESVDEILEVIKEFAFNNSAEIHLINGDLPEYFDHEAKKAVNQSTDLIHDAIANEALKILTTYIAPILKKNAWKFTSSRFGVPVIAYKDENDEWDNVKETRDYYLIDFICYKFLHNLGMMEGVNLIPESHFSIRGIPQFIGLLDVKDLIELDLYIEL